MPDFDLTPVDYEPQFDASDVVSGVPVQQGGGRLTINPQRGQVAPEGLPPPQPTPPSIQAAMEHQRNWGMPSAGEQLGNIGASVLANPITNIAQRGAEGAPQPPLSDDPAEMDRYQEAQKRYYGGNFMDVLGLAVPQMAAPERSAAGIFGSRPMQAYHGSPYDFERFDSSKIGTGEGAQSYGHGLYFAENPEVAESYRQSIGPKNLGGMEENDAALQLRYTNGDRNAAIARLQGAAQSYRDRGLQTPRMAGGWNILAEQYDRAAQLLKRGWEPPKSKMYQVDIDADPAKFIDLDVPWNEQPQVVRDIIRKAGGGLHDNAPMSMDSALADAGNDIRYKQLQDGKISLEEYNSSAGSKQAGRMAVAQAFHEAGIPGFKYLDEKSRRPGWSSLTQAQLEAKISSLRTDLESGLGNQNKMRNELASLERELENYSKQTQNAVVFDDKLINIRSKLGALGSGEGSPETAALAALPSTERLHQAQQMQTKGASNRETFKTTGWYRGERGWTDKAPTKEDWPELFKE